MRDEDPGTGPPPRAEGCDCHLCRPEGDYEPPDLATIETVVRHGWQVVLVGGGACQCCNDSTTEHGQDDGPVFAHTVGLGHRAGHPELLMSGLDPDLMHRALNNLSQRVVDGRRLAPGDVLEGVLGGAPVALAAASTYALDELQPTAWRDAFVPTGALEPDPVWVFPVPPDTRAFTCRHVLDEGRPVLFVARESDTTRGEDWTVHCGSADHETDDVVVVHLAHVVRGAPSVRALADLPLDWEADRDDVDSDWRPRAVGS